MKTNQNNKTDEQKHSYHKRAVGVEFQVNSYTTGFQQYPAITSLTSGDFVVVWMSGGQDGDGYGVYGRRYLSSGVPQGSEFRVNTFTTGTQQCPAISSLVSGDFVVVWMSDVQDGSANGIYGQRYASNGATQGTEFRVNSYTVNSQQFPAISSLVSGDFVVVWSSLGQDGSNDGIYAQGYSSLGVAQGAEFRVNSYTGNWQAYPAISSLVSGEFVVVWHSNLQDGSNNGIYGQRYSSSGVAQGTEFRVNSYTMSYQGYPAISSLTSGDFVVAWESDGQDGSADGIYGQRYAGTGVPQGTEFQVNSYTTSEQNRLAISSLPSGDFVVVWTSDGQDGSLYGVYAQRYSSVGIPQDSEFLVNSYTTGNQGYLDLHSTAVSALPNGDFVVAWESDGQDGDGYGIYAHIFPSTTGLTTSSVSSGVSSDISSSVTSGVTSSATSSVTTNALSSISSGVTTVLTTGLTTGLSAEPTALPPSQTPQTSMLSTVSSGASGAPIALNPTAATPQAETLTTPLIVGLAGGVVMCLLTTGIGFWALKRQRKASNHQSDVEMKSHSQPTETAAVAIQTGTDYAPMPGLQQGTDYQPIPSREVDLQAQAAPKVSHYQGLTFGGRGSEYQSLPKKDSSPAVGYDHFY